MCIWPITFDLKFLCTLPELIQLIFELKKHNVWIILTVTNTQMKHIVLFITDYFVSKCNKVSLLLTSFMIKDMIKSLTYSISFGHCAATESTVSKASKKLYIPELWEKVYIYYWNIVVIVCENANRCGSRGGPILLGKGPRWGLPWKPRRGVRCVCVPKHTHVRVWERKCVHMMNGHVPELSCIH